MTKTETKRYMPFKISSSTAKLYMGPEAIWRGLDLRSAGHTYYLKESQGEVEETQKLCIEKLNT